MDKEKELNRTNDIVKQLLINDPKTRNSDNHLYCCVVKSINADALCKPFWEVLEYMNDFGLPCFETVRRARQKIQAEHPDLKASDVVESLRSVNEEIYKEYARS